MNKHSLSILASITVLVSVQLACSLFEGKPTATPTEQPPTSAPVAEVQATETANPPQEENCPPLPAAQTNPSGLVSEIVMAKNVEETTMAPVDPTKIYGKNDIFHAVVHTENAPANSKFRTVWYATDIGDPASCNSRIDEHSVSADGTRYIDFNLTPETSWPAGRFRAEVYVNDILEQVLDFSVE